MSRGGVISNRRYSYPVVKQECIETVESPQIMNLTSIFSSPTNRSSETLTQIKEEPNQWNYVCHGQGLTPNGPSYRPLVEKSISGRTQVGFKGVKICKHCLVKMHA